MWEILAWVFGGGLVLGVIVIVSVFVPMIFIAKITEGKLKLSPEVIPLRDGISVSEISDNEEVLPYVHRPGTGDVTAAVEMLLCEDGTIEDGTRVFDADPRRQVHVLFRANGQPSLVFTREAIFRFENNRLGERLGHLTNPGLSGISYAIEVLDNTLLVSGYVASAPHVDERLYQVKVPELSQEEITKDTYYTFSRPPMVFVPKGFDGAVAVYYTGAFSFAFGGDCSRPKFSVIRIYNAHYPGGVDILKFGFKAGTVVNVIYQDGALILQADPSLPSMVDKPRKPARIWRVELN